MTSAVPGKPAGGPGGLPVGGAMRVMGSETEYGIHAPSAPGANATMMSARVIQAYAQVTRQRAAGGAKVDYATQLKEQQALMWMSGEGFTTECAHLRKWLKKALRAKTETVEANLRLVISIAQKYTNRGPSSLAPPQDAHLGQELEHTSHPHRRLAGFDIAREDMAHASASRHVIQADAVRFAHSAQ